MHQQDPNFKGFLEGQICGRSNKSTTPSAEISADTEFVEIAEHYWSQTGRKE